MNGHLKIVVLILCLFSVVYKFSNLGHGMPNWTTDDTQHIVDAGKMWSSYTQKDLLESSRIAFEKEWSSQSVYPRGTTYLYLLTIKLFNISEHSMLSLVRCARGVYCSLFALVLLTLWLLPIEKNIKYGALFLLALSPLVHHFTLVTRVHMPTGAFAFFSYAFAILYHKYPKAHYLFFLSLLAAAYATTCFFSGILSFIPVGICLIANIIDRKVHWALAFVMVLSSAVGLFYLLDHFGVFNSLRADNYDVLSMKSYYKFNIKRVISVVFGNDPLLGIGYCIGLYMLIRSKKIKTPLWLMTISPVLIYQILFLFVGGTHVRHSMYSIFFVSLVAAFGWLTIYKSRPKITFAIVATFSLFYFCSLLKHGELADKDTRKMAYHYLAQTLPPETNILLDLLGPNLIYTEKDSKFMANILISSKNHLIQRYNYSQSHRDYLHSYGLKKEDLIDPKGILKVMKRLEIGYYVSNSTWELRGASIDSKYIKEKGRLIKRWHPNSDNSDPISGHWPNDTGNLLWDLWRMDQPGPIVELWEMPWSQSKLKVQTN